MSSLNFGQSSPTGTSLSHEFRRASAGFPSYDHFQRRRSPSPGPSARRQTYDSYKPRVVQHPPYYDDHPNTYRPNVYRPERYVSRSPSPPRYDRARPQEARQWDHGARWQSSSYYDKLSPPPWDKNRRDTLAERMFEPSELWKQSHFDRPARYEPLDPTPDRYGDRRQQPPRDLSPPRSAARSDFASHYDSYRPAPVVHAVRDLGSFSRTADTYRPQYLGDDVGLPRRPNYYDREEERPESSIASTPPRSQAPLSQSLSKSQHRSPPPRIFTQGETYPRQYTEIVSGHQPFSPSVSPSRGSSISGEAPVTKFESRSLSRSSGRSRSAISEPDEDSLPQSSIQPVQAKAPPHALNETPLANNNEEAPSEGSKSLGTLVGTSAEQRSPCHETVNMNGNFASNQLTLERNASPLPTPELISSSDATPHRDSPHEVATPHVDADAVTIGSLRDTSEESTSKGDRAVVPVPSASRDLATFSTSIPDVEPDGHRESPLSSAAALPFMARPLRPGPEAVPGFTRAGLGIDHMDVNMGISDQLGNSLRIVVSDHSVTLGSPPLDRTILYQPDSANLKSTREGVRLVLVARLGGDRQSRAERVFPVLRANQAVSSLNLPPLPVNQSSRSEELIAASSSNGLVIHEAVRSSLVDRFVARQSEIVEKSRRLKEEYLALHERWLEHCARLDEAQKGGVQEESTIPSGGRATRRSTAVMGDAVRSDLEMEQIIASLGVEELTDPNYLAIKNVARIPDMISVTDGSVPYVFDDTNNIVDDPSEFYSASSGQDYWTEEERDIFLNEFAARPKQFGLIAQRLPNKTAAQCVTYYYLHKKQGVDFKKAVMQYGTNRRRKNGRANKQKSNALLTDIRRHDDEVSRTSPRTPTHTPSSTGNKRKRAVERTNGESRRSSTSRRSTIQPEATSSGTTPDPDVDPPRRKRRAARAVAVVLADDVVNDDVMDCPVPA